jgi:hypothetical protein
MIDTVRPDPDDTGSAAARAAGPAGRPVDGGAEGGTSSRLMLVDLVATGIFVVAQIVSAVFLRGVRYVGAAVSIALFVVGCGAFLVAYARAIRRSRTAEIGIGGLYFLAGSTAPRPVKFPMLGALAAQIVVALATAGARPFTSLAYGILAPVFGIGLNGLWSSRYGRFGARVVEPSRPVKGRTTREVPPPRAPSGKNGRHG